MISDVQMVTMVTHDQVMQVDADLVCVQVVMEAECNMLTRAVWIHVLTFHMLSVTADGVTLVRGVVEAFFSCEEY